MALVSYFNVFFVAFGELFFFGFLLCEGTDNSHSEKAVLNSCVDFADLMSALLEGITHTGS